MTRFKKVILSLFFVSISSCAYADIIELDPLFPDDCRQQLLKSADNVPVIAAYRSDSEEDTQLFMTKFEALAKAHPERTFFKLDAAKDFAHQTQTLCLQQLGITVQPSLMLLGIFKEDGDLKQPMMSAPIRLDWAGDMTTADMNKFITIPDSNLRKAFLVQKNHH